MRAKTALSLAAACGLLVIESNYAAYFVLSDILSRATWLELLVFGVQFVKTGSVLATRRLRDGSPALLIDIYGAELMSVPVLVVAALVVGEGQAGATLGQLVQGWVAGVSCAGIPLVVFRLGRGMLGSAPLASVIPTTIVTAEIGVLFANAALSAAKAGTGLAGVAEAALLGKGSIESGNLLVYAALADVFASLLIYAVLGMNSNPIVDVRKGLATAAGATGITLVWVFVFSVLPLSSTLVMLPATLAVGGTAWWFGRGR
jgi:hypothetical protein